MPSLRREPKAIASPRAQSAVRDSTISMRALRIRSRPVRINSLFPATYYVSQYIPLWITNSAALGGGEENRLPMWVRVSSFTPVGDTLRGSLPSKKPDQGESNQSLYLTWVSLRAFWYASSQIFSYLSATSYKTFYIEKKKKNLKNVLQMCWNFFFNTPLCHIILDSEYPFGDKGKWLIFSRKS
jgi:hypothetical protein